MEFEDWFKQLKEFGKEYGYENEIIEYCRDDWKRCCFDNGLSPKEAILEDIESW